ncbi:MAG: hypothetical protein ABSA15_05060 [Thermoplasmata archaeon]
MASTSHKKSRRGSTSTKRPSKTRPARKATPRPKPKHAPRRPAHPPKKVAKKAAPPKPKPAARIAPPRAGAPPTQAAAPAPPRSGDGRRHVLSLSFLRDGDEFLARIETDAGQITEFKHRVLDQLLSLVASELEDLLE